MKNLFTESLFSQMATVTIEELGKAETQLKSAGRHGDEIGVISDDLKKLFAVILRSKRQADEATAKAISIGLSGLKSVDDSSGEEVIKTFEKSAAIIARASAENDFFWASVMAELDIFGSTEISLVRGWKVVYNEPVCDNCGERHENLPFGLVEVEVAGNGRGSGDAFLRSLFRDQNPDGL